MNMARQCWDEARHIQIFEKLIDHPSWIEHVKHFVGGEGTFDYNHGPLFIDENFANIRGPGESIAGSPYKEGL